MKLIIKILLGIFVLSIVGGAALMAFSDIEVMQHSVVKTVPNEKILIE